MVHSRRNRVRRTLIAYLIYHPDLGVLVQDRAGSEVRVFISWSGERSKAIAQILHRWLPGVLQAVKPYYSPDDIAKGTRWSSEIARELEASRVGLICLTSDNLFAPWILFEAGALSKNLDQSRVCPILFGVEPSDVSGPLVQFQASRFDREEMKRVVGMMNSELGDQALAPDVLDSVFEMWWPKLQTLVEEALQARPTDNQAPPSGRSGREILEEILALMRSSDSHDYLVERLDGIEDGMTRIADALRMIFGDDMPKAGYDPASAPTHRVKFRGSKSQWPVVRQALYATGRVGMIEVAHEDGLFDVTITTRGPLNRATIYRIIRAGGFEILAREPNADTTE